jgi:hypothetical protein
MKKLFFIFLFFFNNWVFAQDEPIATNAAVDSVEKERADGWLKGGSGNFTFSQVSLTNWAGGGQNSVAGNIFMNVFANYKKGKSQWDNNLDLAYGVIRQGGGDYIKSDDRVDLTTKYGRNWIRNWNYAGLVNFRTQMAPGYDLGSINTRIKISDVLAPAYVVISLGLDYKPNDNFSLFISPVTTKITIVNDQTLANAGAFGVRAATYDTNGFLVEKGLKHREEYGAYLKMIYKTELFENALFTTKLDLFSNYLNNPQNFDIFWDNSLLIKVGKYFAVNFALTFVYDHDIQINIDDNGDGLIEKTGPRTQIKQVFGFGLSFKL